jgi:hypothetical protein
LQAEWPPNTPPKKKISQEETTFSCKTWKITNVGRAVTKTNWEVALLFGGAAASLLPRNIFVQFHVHRHILHSYLFEKREIYIYIGTSCLSSLTASQHINLALA